ncbi:N,N-dimethylformamidase beta subunit family domain-containing protein [Microbacterium foliorum]|uniref:N,N-dimethylformamidase beta subunit family domain-containing protein n=1 Tax=Microbacterium foliorum TaxID=104336 RepID=UPI0028D85B38|nr:N,N-dimethylformamidase beta subunit family domain-containing protein [Microbacterium foliorum]
MRHDSPHIFGYTDRFSARPGETLTFHVSCENLTAYNADLVQLRHGYTGATGPGFLETELPSAFNGSYTGAWHECRPGSYVEVPDPGGLLRGADGVRLHATVFATMPLNERGSSLGAYHVTQNSMSRRSAAQSVMGTWDTTSETGYGLILDGGIPTFVWNVGGDAQRLALDTPLLPNQWYELDVTYAPGDGRVTLTSRPRDSLMNRLSAQAAALQIKSATTATAGSLLAGSAPFRIGASTASTQGARLAVDVFNGKIGEVRVNHADDIGPSIAAWHFGKSNREDGFLLRDVIDESPNGLHGTCINAPTRAVAGASFSGLIDDFRLAPDEYDAIHFHDDDITDADWPTAFSFAVPNDLPSGVYAARLRAEGAVQHVPFFVLPDTRAKKSVALLFSTATYLAYGNDRIAFEADGAEVIVGHTPIIDPEDLTLQDHPEFGRSCYELHNDGSGVVFGSVRRPILTLQPKHRAWFQAEGVWGLPADLCIAHWLETEGVEFDALTDQDLDREGVALLDGYEVVITGAHPEYVTRAEIEALDQFTAGGGRLMYLGGNGFFATVSFDPEQPHLMELRRSDGGTRPHQSAYGDQRHATSGERAGLWRNKGLPPQRLLGVGFVAQGFDRGTHYVRLQDSFDPRVRFAFEGIGDEELLGDFGIMGGGAAGAEIDCYQPVLGSSSQALVLATSAPMSDAYLLAAEEIFEMLPGLGGTEQVSVRSDIVLTALESGGAVFSVGSIAYTAALSHAGYDNNIARLTGNVLRRLLVPEPLLDFEPDAG